LRCLKVFLEKFGHGHGHAHGHECDGLFSSEGCEGYNFFTGSEHMRASKLMLEKEIQQYCTEKKVTLALAESCTGGMIAARLTSVPGASEYFLGSFVTYSESLKKSILHVPDAVLKKKGVVSKEAVTHMCKGVFNVTHSDYAIAVTGIAGPSGGTSKVPVGTIWCAIGRRNQKPYVWKMQLKGNRKKIVQECTTKILEEFLIFLHACET